MDNYDEYDEAYDEILEEGAIEESCLTINEAIIVGRYTAIQLIEKSMRSELDSLAALKKVKQMIDNELITGCIDTENWPTDLPI